MCIDIQSKVCVSGWGGWVRYFTSLLACLPPHCPAPPPVPACVRACVSGGDGPKRSLLQQMVTTEGLEARVTLAGAIPHERARDFLVRLTYTHNWIIFFVFCTTDAREFLVRLLEGLGVEP